VRKLVIRLVVAATVMFSVGVAAAPSGFAIPLQCNGVLTGTVNSNVEVPPGGSCEIRGATVVGNVVVDAGAHLQVDNSTITGKITGQREASIVVNGSGEVPTKVGGAIVSNRATEQVSICGLVQIGGPVVIKNGGDGGGVIIGPGFSDGEGPSCSSQPLARIRSADGQSATNLQGPVVLWRNAGHVSVNDTSFGSSLSAVSNTGGGQIDNNVIAGNLVCLNNIPPFTANGNSVGGTQTGC
jgi:hypothetical protein